LRHAGGRCGWHPRGSLRARDSLPCSQHNHLIGSKALSSAAFIPEDSSALVAAKSILRRQRGPCGSNDSSRLAVIPWAILRGVVAIAGGGFQWQLATTTMRLRGLTKICGAFAKRRRGLATRSAAGETNRAARSLQAVTPVIFRSLWHWQGITNWTDNDEAAGRKELAAKIGESNLRDREGVT
jgi:hypothetical protein